jgi:hypothetical protein
MSVEEYDLMSSKDKVNSQQVNDSTVKSKVFTLTDDIIDRWGDGYTRDQYKAFERKYNHIRKSYSEKTAIHTEALCKYVRFSCMEEIATANGEHQAAKNWGVLAKDAASAAKLQVVQLSASDLSEGLDTFGQVARKVEESIDIIPILPQFKRRYVDDVDFTIHMYVNYIRNLQGLPDVEYSEIYDYLERRKEQYLKDTGQLEDKDGDN